MLECPFISKSEKKQVLMYYETLKRPVTWELAKLYKMDLTIS